MSASRFPDMNLRPDESVCEFMDGRLRLIQSRTGYRFSIDAILLSEFVLIKPGDIVLDLGTGCGVIPLILLLTRPVRYALGMEIQSDMAYQAVRNASLNGFEHKMDIVRGDIRYPPLKSSSVDVVVCNPPYRKIESGRVNPDQQKAIARHEILASIDDILETASRLLKAKGRLAIVYPVERLVDIVVRMRAYKLEPKRIRIVYPGPRSEAKFFLIEASLGGGGGLKILPPLMNQGDYSISIQA